MRELALILNESGWQDYQLRFMEACSDHTLQPDPWIRRPANYPCLAASTVIGDLIATCFVYRHDAEWLLSEGVKQAATPARDTETPVTQAEFNRYMCANVRTMIRILRGANDISAARYEAMFAESLVWVDQRESENRDAYLSGMKGVGESSA